MKKTMEKVSLRMALGFGKLWKSETELADLTGLSIPEIISGIRDLQKSGSTIAENCQNGRYMYAMAARMIETKERGN
jgi:biotin operon repressor